MANFGKIIGSHPNLGGTIVCTICLKCVLKSHHLNPRLCQLHHSWIQDFVNKWKELKVLNCQCKYCHAMNCSSQFVVYGCTSPFETTILWLLAALINFEKGWRLDYTTTAVKHRVHTCCVQMCYPFCSVVQRECNYSSAVCLLNINKWW